MQYNEWYEVHTQYKSPVYQGAAPGMVQFDTYEEALAAWKMDCNDWGVKQSKIFRQSTVELAHHGKAAEPDGKVSTP